MTSTRNRLTWLVQHRLALFLTLLAIQCLFFVTNGLNSVLREPTDGWELVLCRMTTRSRPTATG